MITNIYFLVLIGVFLALVGAHDNRPRCGSDDETIQRTKRFALNNGMHRKVNVTYKMIEYSKNFSREATDKLLRKAFDLWSEHVDLNFINLDSVENPDITLKFAIREHGDGFPFDGPGGVLAHAVTSWVHFDDEETWASESSDEGTNFLSVAVHEIGHSLGLGHSNIQGSIMFPFYSDDGEGVKLHEDDVLGIQEVYKKKKDYSKFDLDLCKDPTFDTMFTTPDGKTYILKNDVYYELDGLSVVDGPKNISEKWIGLPGEVDAAFSQNGKTFFFKRGNYWRYTGNGMDEGYPIRLNHYYSELPQVMDDAMVWSDNKVYFFRGASFYRIDEFNEKYTQVYKGIVADEWKGIPHYANAIIYHPNHQRTYFFKDDAFWVYDSSSDAHPPYTIPTTSYFFDCAERPE